jgi:hypothetical protein
MKKMTNKEYNEKTVDLFKRMKPLNEEFKALEINAPKTAYYYKKTLKVLADCTKAFLEGEAIQSGWLDD